MSEGIYELVRASPTLDALDELILRLEQRLGLRRGVVGNYGEHGKQWHQSWPSTYTKHVQHECTTVKTARDRINIMPQHSELEINILYPFSNFFCLQ